MVHRSVHHNPFSAEEERMASMVLYMSISLVGEHGLTHLRYRVRRPRGA